MGYLDNSSVTVDAILTNKGREMLAAGGKLDITKFALSDDEIDYDLYNPAHTLGTNYYGSVIEAMPILEALPDETQMLRYKLVTLPKDATGIPVISVTPSSISLTSLTQEVIISPSTLNMAGANSIGYTAILSDDTVCSLEVTAGSDTDATATNAASGFLSDASANLTTAGNTVIRTGLKFTVKAKQQANTSDIKRALITIIGNETGGFKTITVTVDPNLFLVQNVIADK